MSSDTYDYLLSRNCSMLDRYRRQQSIVMIPKIMNKLARIRELNYGSRVKERKEKKRKECIWKRGVDREYLGKGGNDGDLFESL